MARKRWTPAVTALLALAPACLAQRLTPLGDTVESPLLPAGVSSLPITIDGELAYMFEDEAGVDVVHVVGEFALRFGADGEGYALESREAVLWIEPRESTEGIYTHLEALLWQEGIAAEVGGTVEAAPMLFAVIDTAGPVKIGIDDLTMQEGPRRGAYEQALAVRAAVADRAKFRAAPGAFRVWNISGLGGPAADALEPAPVIQFRARGDLEGPFAHGGLELMTVTGGVYLSRGVPGSGRFLEIQATAASVVLPPGARGLPGRGAEVPPGEAGLGGQRVELEEVEPQAPADAPKKEERQERPLLSTAFGDVEVEAVYLEGDVVMSQGPNQIRASRIYYDFLRDQALILDAVIRSPLPDRNLPLYLRAAEIRQLSLNRFAAEDAKLTTSEFFTPHYHVGAGMIEVVNRTPPGVEGPARELRSGSFRVENATLNVGGVTVGYWPYLRGDLDVSETAIRGLSTGYSDEFGLELETDWELFHLLNLEQPAGFDTELSLDFFSERGPATGVDAVYVRDRYHGLVRSYLMTDNDRDFLGEERETPSQYDVRGRFLQRHRQYLEDDWQLTLETSYISDEYFLEEYFESEFDTEKEQETLLYLKQQRNNWAFTVLLQARLMDFLTQTERLPDLAFIRVGETLGDWAVWHTSLRLGMLRYRPKDQNFFEFLRDGRLEGSGTVVRFDSRHELESPLDVGPVRLVPFVTYRRSSWDDSPDSGGTGRNLALYGVRGSLYFWRVYPKAQSELFDLQGIRHIIKTDVVAWGATSDREPDELYPFDETVEEIEAFDGVQLGLRQRWQTKRGSGPTRRTVDFLTLDLEAGFFNDASGQYITNGYTAFARPEESIARNYLNSSLIWRMNDRTALLGELNYDINDAEMDIFNLSLAVERPPRLSYVVGYRFIEESESNLLGLEMNYTMTEKHRLAVRERFDLGRGRTLDFTVALIRRFPRWFGALAFELDEPRDDFGVSFSIWPEGLPAAALGSWRYTGLSDSPGAP